MGETRPDRFRFRDASALRKEAVELGLDLPWSESTAPLFLPLDLAGRRLPHRLISHPMEGADSDEQGRPTGLTVRRYERLAAGGFSLIWFEAAAVVAEGRSSPHQLLLTAMTVGAFRRLVEATRAAAVRAGRPDPLLILQLTHSGRFARPNGKPEPIIVRRDPALDALRGIPADYPILSDAGLDRLQDAYGDAVALADRAGFDGVDIKACHGYLAGELLSARDRPGRYGGSLENRARLLTEIAEAARIRAPRLLLASRLGVFDGLPGGFGVSAGDPGRPDLDEPIELVQILRRRARLDLINVTAGIPAWRAHYGRPFDRPAAGAAPADEPPLAGVARLIGLAASLSAKVPGLPVAGTGYSWLRGFFPRVAAGALAGGRAALIGLGRLSFAYPEAPADLLAGKEPNSRRLCTACSACSTLLREGRPAGCVVRDAGVYTLGG